MRGQDSRRNRATRFIVDDARRMLEIRKMVERLSQRHADKLGGD